MQIKGSLAKGLLFALAISLIPVVAVSAQKITPGSTCKVLNQKIVYQNKTYSCIKSGKKLVWNNGIVLKPTPTPTPIPIPTATPTPTATPKPTPTPQKIVFTPWATQFDLESMIQTALDATRTYFGKVIPSNDYEITFDPAISFADRAWVTEITDFAYGSFSNIKKERTIIYIGATREWALEALKSKNIWIGDPNAIYPCSAKNDDGGCAGSNKFLLLFSAGRLLNQGPSDKFSLRTSPAHEFFHIIQENLYKNSGPGTPMRIPQWLFEGSANFYMFYAGEELGFGKYQTGRENQVTQISEYRTLVPLSQYDGGSLYPYGIGQAASEYIIASIGFENFLNIWRFTKSENSFSAGFKKATGIELDTFYSKFEIARSYMRIGS